ncbi:MAG TPA: hypothetical protein DHW40_11075 [Microbacterium sp.]|nr:hypothetical protein [Microbacterium sp.]
MDDEIARLEEHARNLAGAAALTRELFERRYGDILRTEGAELPEQALSVVNAIADLTKRAVEARQAADAAAREAEERLTPPTQSFTPTEARAWADLMDETSTRALGKFLDAQKEFDSLPDPLAGDPAELIAKPGSIDWDIVDRRLTLLHDMESAQREMRSADASLDQAIAALHEAGEEW